MTTRAVPSQRLQDRLTAALTTVLLDARTRDGMGAADSINAAAATILCMAGFTTAENRQAVVAALRRAGEMAIGAAVSLEIRKL